MKSWSKEGPCTGCTACAVMPDVAIRVFRTAKAKGVTHERRRTCFDQR